jgi:hypothetical protein
VNVTRMAPGKESKASFPHDEKYLGEVVTEQDGGCVRGTRRVPGISGSLARSEWPRSPWSRFARRT